MKFSFTAILCLIFFRIASAQEADSLNLSFPDTLNVSAIDTLVQEKVRKKSDIDTVVYSSASDSLIFYVKEKQMNMFGDGKIEYKSMKITSANIYIDFSNNKIKAEGELSDSAGGKLINTPVLVEGSESYQGKAMTYNFKTGQGTMAAANTEFEGTFYSGEKIKKVDKKTYFIKHGRYTTCDKECPHYYFEAPRMKIIQDEEAVAEWIWLYFGDVPFPIPLPFAVFPLQSGRRSGLIAPVFGEDATYGTYLARMGYFWAISDYMDVNLTLDYYTRGSFRLTSRFRYAKRYSYTGNIEGSFSDFTQGESTDPDFSEQKDWRIRWYHNQTITPTLRFDANLEFVSTNYLNRNVGNINDLLRDQIISNATLSKTWEESGSSLTLNYNRRQLIQTNDVYEVLPSINFTQSQVYPFRSEFGSGERSWYEYFGFAYNGQFQNQRNKVGGDLKIRAGVRHNLTFDFSPKVGYFSITPKLSYQERWYNKRVKKVVITSSTGEDSVVTNDVNEINFVRTFDTRISASTKFYGMFPSIIPGISAFRHTVTPSITYSYRPDFSTPGWGYYDSYRLTDGTEVKYNKYEREIYGGPSSQEVSAISFSMGNIFEMKTRVDPTDTTDKEEKYQLLNFNLGMGYNFAADSLNFSDLRVSYRTQISDFFDFSGSNTFTLYDYAGTTSRVNKFLIDEGKGLFRMTNFNLTASLRLSGEKLKSDERNLSATTSDEFGIVDMENRSVYQGLYTNRDPDFTIPWDITLSYTYNLSRPTPENEFISSNINGSLNFNLTPNWKFSITGNYNLQQNEFVAPQIRVSRDLHCWIMNFTWNPIGTYQGYRFEIRIKAPQLQDLKITKQDQFFNTR